MCASALGCREPAVPLTCVCTPHLLPGEAGGVESGGLSEFWERPGLCVLWSLLTCQCGQTGGSGHRIPLHLLLILCESHQARELS